MNVSSDIAQVWVTLNPAATDEHAERHGVDAGGDADRDGVARGDRLHGADMIARAAGAVPRCGAARPFWQDLRVDRIDHAIIDELTANARLSNVELAERVNLSPSPCLRRVRALEDAGVIRGYHADVDPAAVGRGFEVSVLIELTRRTARPSRSSSGGSPGMDAVLECRRMFGVPDYIVRVAVADAAPTRPST